MSPLLLAVLLLCPSSDAGPLSAEETRAFMKELLAYVEANHLKKDPK
ncbi:MAG: hypothetical protein U0736_22470 [Gemmataceae bacterium]